MSNYYHASPRRLCLCQVPASWAGYDHLLIAGQHAEVSAYILNSGLDLSAALASIKEPKSGGVVSSFIQVEGSALKVTLCVNPLTSSRMNHPARPDVLTKSLSAQVKPKERTAILLCPADELHHEAVGAE